MASLCIDFYKEKQESITEIDKVIRNYINQDSGNYYDEIIKNDNNYEVFYHLSHLRGSLLNWYDFKPNSRILEIGSQFGALTGVLCRGGQSVTAVETSLFRAETMSERYPETKNLTIYAGDIYDIGFDKKSFDYIILNESFDCDGKRILKEDFGTLLTFVRTLLTDTGIMLLGLPNRYGIKYFCGEPDPYTGTPFGALSQDGTGSFGLSRDGVICALLESGFEMYKFYYPLPDAQFPQLIYSDPHLPGKDVCERLAFYYRKKDSLIMSERNFYEDILANDTFSFFANSYLVECGNKENFCTAVYAAVSTDRGKEHAFATTIHNKEFVQKKPIYGEGTDSAELIWDNILEMQEHQIKVVPHEKHAGSLWMPYINSITFSDYLRKQVQENRKEEFCNLIDLLYQQILKSSEHASPEDNVFLKRGYIEGDYGIILKKAYIDMVPFNCFYYQGEFLFFDQEFVRINFPAKYTLFRALKYTYLSIPEAETMVSLEALKEKYTLGKVWEAFCMEEDQFVADNRRYGIYNNFYSWTWIDKGQMQKNINLLSGKEVMI